MYIDGSSTTSQSQWWCSGVGEGGWRVREWEHTLLTFAFLTMSSSPSNLEGFVSKRHHSPSWMRQETWAGFGGFVLLLFFGPFV